MKRFIPSPSMAVAATALFVAMGGSSYAAVTLHKNSVTSATIRNGSIRMADLNPSIRPQKTNKLFRTAVADSLLDPGTKAAVDAIAGAVKGEPGTAGVQGATGATGAVGPAVVTRREAVGPDVSQGGQSGANAVCLPGEKVTGGGASFEASSGVGGAALTVSQPTDGAQAWSANYSVTGPATTGHIRVYVLCAA